MAADVLFLAHRIPFPPDKGDKIRSWHQLQYLCANHRVHLGCFIDDPVDWQHVDRLRELTADLFVEGIHPRWKKLLSLGALARREAMSFAYFGSAGLRRWCRGRPTIDLAFAFSSSMAPYILDRSVEARRRVVDFVDLDSEKWRLLAPKKSRLMRAILEREAEALASAETEIAAAADEVWLISDAERADLLARRGVPQDRVITVPNGVDSTYFAQEHRGHRPAAYSGRAPAIVFSGAMDYEPNVDAVLWFSEHVWPSIRAAWPEACFAVVGARPVPAVTSLANQPGIVVTGRVADIRPWIGHADLAVAPIRVARGIQNKILEAMAMGRPVIASRAGVTGMVPSPALVADTPDAMLAAVNEVAGDAAKQRDLGTAGRTFVAATYGWNVAYQHFDRLLTRTNADAAAA